LYFTNIDPVQVPARVRHRNLGSFLLLVGLRLADRDG
jgi:hypothetical protein